MREQSDPSNWEREQSDPSNFWERELGEMGCCLEKEQSEPRLPKSLL